MYEKDIDFVLKRYKDLFGFDLSYMTFKVDSRPVYTNGEPCYEYDEDECAGDWTTLGWIRLNPDMKSVMDRYGVAWHGSDDVEKFTRIIIAHELAHELWNNVVCEDFKRSVLDKARRENFSTAYLKTIKPSKLSEETFCEYMANAVVCRDEKPRFYKIDARDNAVADCGELYNKIGQFSDRLNDKGQYMVTLWKRLKKLEFKSVAAGELKQILYKMPSYTDNSRLKMSQFEKYMANDGALATLWYGCFDKEKCMALAVLKRYRDDGIILLAEIQSAVRGYGKPLIENILRRADNIWWCADPAGGESLVAYYRQFARLGVKEHLIRRSKWANGVPECAFYKAEDSESEKIILDTLDMADMESTRFSSKTL